MVRQRIKANFQKRGASTAASPTDHWPLATGHCSPRPSAFTLVELLVVIGIIALLMALLLPAVNAARQTAQVTKCAYRMGELGKAMIAYDLDMQHLPGFANIVHGNTVSWTVTLLPYIGRNDLWEGSAGAGDVGWRGGNTTSDVSYIDLFVCPSDSPMTNTPLSFAVSLGSNTNSVNITGASATGVFRDLTNSVTKTVSATDVKSRSQRPMIVENACTNVSYNTTPQIVERQWNLTGNSVTAAALGFVWPPSNTNQLLVATLIASPANSTSWSGGSFSTTISGAVIGVFPPIHSGGRLNVTFCDGSVRIITRDDPDNTIDPIRSVATPQMQCSKFDCTNQQ